MNLFILLPAYNEEKDLERLVKGLAAHIQNDGRSYQIIVVDDGSQDQTPRIAQRLKESYPLTLVQHPQNRGYGAAIRTGFDHVASVAKEEDILITMDCDNTHPPDYIFAMISEIEKGQDLVIASRYQKGGGQVGFSWKRRLLSITSNWLLRTLFPTGQVRDYTSGYRAYRVSLLEKARQHYGEDFIESKGFTVPMEILLKLRTFGIKVKEIPLVLRYDLKDGMSKMKAMKTILAYMKVLWQIRRRISS